MRELQSLTPLRGLAALAVLGFHVVPNRGDPSALGFFARGYLGVELFFVLSGFVLTHVYLDRFVGGASWHAVAAFLRVRLARIYPVHFFVTALLVVASAPGTYSAVAVMANFLLMQVPWPVTAINPPSWSLSAEWYAYLLFPFIAGRLWRCGDRSAAVICFALIVVFDLLIVGVLGNLREIGGWDALACALPEFVVGVLTYRAFCDARAWRFWRSDAAFVAIAVALGVAFEFLPDDGVVVALFPLLLLAAVSNTGRAARLLNVRPLRWMGDISYSVYLGQVFALSAALALSHTPAGPILGLGGLQALAAVLALGLGVLIHRVVEVPCRAFLRSMPRLGAATSP